MWESLYRSIKVPCVPIYGFFPVKLRTHLGTPIYPRPGVSPEELSREVVVAMEELISQHQQLPGTLTQVMLQDIGTEHDQILSNYKKLHGGVCPQLVKKC